MRLIPVHPVCIRADGHSGAPGAGGARTSAKRSRRVAVAVVVVLAAVSCAKADEPEALTSTVECRSGEPVVGVWVEAANERSGFAQLDLSAPDPSQVDFVYRLPRDAAYELNVGCGGTGASWGSSNDSDVVFGSGRRFSCEDGIRQVPQRDGTSGCSSP